MFTSLEQFQQDLINKVKALGGLGTYTRPNGTTTPALFVGDEPDKIYPVTGIEVIIRLVSLETATFINKKTLRNCCCEVCYVGHFAAGKQFSLPFLETVSKTFAKGNYIKTEESYQGGSMQLLPEFKIRVYI